MRPIVAKIASKIPPRFRILPASATLIISTLVVVNIVVWIAVAIVLRYEPSLAASAVLSYTLGLRHALDADHISAIDLMTRRLIASGSKPVTVGMFFSLGHSTIVVITCVVVAATSGALEDRFEGFQQVGGIIGTSISAAVLLILGIANAWILVILIKRLRKILKERLPEDGVGGEADKGLDLEGGGVMARVFKKIFKFIDRPWKMYPLGVLFGLGFDTSSEVAVLGIASLHGAAGTSIWLILIFPILFTGTSFSFVIAAYLVSAMLLSRTTSDYVLLKHSGASPLQTKFYAQVAASFETAESKVRSQNKSKIPFFNVVSCATATATRHCHILH